MQLVSQRAALTPDHPLKSELPIGPEEIAGILAEGIAKNNRRTPALPAWSSARGWFRPPGDSGLPRSPWGRSRRNPRTASSIGSWTAEGGGTLELKIKVQKVWANRMPKISFYSPLEVSLEAVATDESYKPDGKSTRSG